MFTLLVFHRRLARFQPMSSVPLRDVDVELASIRIRLALFVQQEVQRYCCKRVKLDPGGWRHRHVGYGPGRREAL